MSHRSAFLPAFMSKQVADARRFYLSEEQVQKQPTGLWVISGGWERTAPDYEIRRKGFQYHALEFVAGGRGTVTIGTRKHHLSRGVVFAYGPTVPHKITTDPTERLSKYFVDFAGPNAAAGNEGRRCAAAGTCHAVAARSTKCRQRSEHLLASGRRGTPTAAKIAALQGQILLLLVSEVRLPSSTRASGARQIFPARCCAHLERKISPR